MPRPGEPVPPLHEYPILNQQEAAKTFKATFQKDCGDNDICESDLFVEAGFLQLPRSSKFAKNLFHAPFDLHCCCIRHVRN